MKRPRGPWLAVLVSVGLLGVAELGLRAGGFRHPPIALPTIVWDVATDLEMGRGETLHRFDARTLWSPRPGAPLPWAEGERVSPGGFRGPDPDPGAAPRVLALGDSSTFGMGVAWEACWARHVERGLRAGPGGEGAQVLDGGIVGATAVQGLERFRIVRDAWGWEPDVVVAAFGAVNEHFPTRAGSDLAKVAASRAGETWSTRLHRWLGRRARLYQAAIWIDEERRGGRPALLAARLEELQRDNAATQGYLERPDYSRRVSVEEFRGTLLRLRDEVEASGGELLLLRMPRRSDKTARLWPLAEYDAALADLAASEGVALVDGAAEFAGLLAAGVREEELFLDGYHPTARGHAALGDAVLRALKGRPVTGGPRR